MASLRNHDQVVFLEPGCGLKEDMTLGADNDYNILYEQHNPDYIPRHSGDRTILVADSHNNRVVEFDRRDSGWEQTWVYSSSRTSWVRDADRLPNGHTLIAGSNSNVVFEIDRSNEVLWEVQIEKPYDAEILSTGDESSGGESASKLGLEQVSSRQERRGGSSSVNIGSVVGTVIGLIPVKIRNGLLYVLPLWVGKTEAFALVALVGSTVIWGGLECYWSAYQINLSSPFEFRRNG